ncbi:MAG: hypothetical protein ABFD64_06435 [Armatimonadota bacterium]
MVKMIQHRLKLPLIILLASCVIGICSSLPARAGDSDWAIPSGPLPDIPEPSDPVIVIDTTEDQDSDSSPANQNSAASNSQTEEKKPDASTLPKADVQPSREELIKQKKEAFLKAFQLPADQSPNIVASSQNRYSPVVSGCNDLGGGPTPSGLSTEEWQEAADCQQALGTLYSKWPLSNAEINEIDELQAKRDALWKKAVSMPGLTQAERDRFRIKLYTPNWPNAQVPSLSEKMLNSWVAPPPLPMSNGKPSEPMVNPVTKWLVDQMQNAVESGGESVMDYKYEENNYSDVLGLSKIAVAYKKGGAAPALAESMNFLVGKIKIPQAAMAVDGGRKYADIVFQAENKFMNDALASVGGSFDQKQFWSDFKEDCNVWQKAVMEWIGYAPE